MGRQRRTPPSDKDGLAAAKPPATNRAFSALLKALDLNQQEAAEVLGLDRNTLSDYARGRKTLYPENYRRKCAAFGLDQVTAEHALALVTEVDGDALSLDFVSEIGSLAERLAASVPARAQELAAEQDQKRCQILWRSLKTLRPDEWQLILTAAPDLQRWAFVKLVGEESTRAASDDTNQALELATLALWVANRIAGEEGWRSRIFAWARLGNARRVRSDLDEARQAFAVSIQLRQEEGHGPIPEAWRLYDLEASLRIDLRQHAEALRLLAQATQEAPQTGAVQARLLSQVAHVHEVMGDSEGALRMFRQAAALVDRETDDPHLVWMVHSNLMGSLCEVGRAAEAAPMLPALRLLAAQVGDGLSQIRLRWIEAKIAAGLGRIAEAVEALSSVRAAFADEKIRYDEALASTELAELYLEQGRTGDVKRLVLLMAPVFTDKGIHQEAHKALALFRRAIELETVTIDLVRHVAAYLRRAQNDPRLPFEETAWRG